MKTLQEQYNLIKKGKGHKGVFLKEAKRLFPNIVPNPAGFETASKLLKQRNVITEKKASKKKTAGYDYENTKNLDNQIFDQYINGLRFEMEQQPELLASNPKECLLKAKDIVAKNLEKDPLYYTKNAAFGIEGLGYTELKNGKEPTGKYKSSGYGDLKENKMSKSTELKELLEEAVAGIPSIGNPFADRKPASYEDKFAAFLAEEKQNAKEAEDPKMEEGEAAYEYEQGKDAGEKIKKEEKSPLKEKKKQPKDFVAEVEKLSERAANEVAKKAYQGKIDSLQETLNTINEDENLAEFIDENKTKAVQAEIDLYEKYCNEATQKLEYSKNNK